MTERKKGRNKTAKAVAAMRAAVRVRNSQNMKIIGNQKKAKVEDTFM